jgi:Right handed beta helix region
MRRLALSRREWLAASAAAAVCAPFKLSATPKSQAQQNSRSKNRQLSNYITPEQFGAVGDGVTNDTDAFAAMAAFVNRHGGGTIALRPTTYIVGKQAPDPTQSGYYLAPAKIMSFSGCTQALSILGNGARIRCADGLRFGTFDPSTGQPTYHPLPYYGGGEICTPYEVMLRIENCTGGVDVSNLELDGNLPRLIIGGPWGDTGWQIRGFGVQLVNNDCSEQVTGIYTHHHTQDGFYIDGILDRNSTSTVQEMVSEYNARQGCTVAGGSGYSFVNCKFNHTGKAGLASSPCAGVDIEAESKVIRDLKFSGCEFANNGGCGMLADSGDSDGATFDSCTFIGATSFAAWPNKPHFHFSNCQFVGEICRPYGDPDPERAAQFTNCVFVDDPTLSPTGQVFGPGRPIGDFGYWQNVLLDGCRFDLKNEMVLPWSTKVIYNNCTMSQVSTTQAYPRGTFTGTNTIVGNVGLAGSIILGDLTVNGVLKPRTA